MTQQIGKIVVDECIDLHRALGPGLLEIVYEVLLARRLEKEGLSVVRQVRGPVEFEGDRFNEGFRADLIIEGEVIPELKSVETISPARKKQLLTYLKLMGLKLGFLLNFGDEPKKMGSSEQSTGTWRNSFVPWCLSETKSEPIVALNPAVVGRREWT
jgi:GxxExxY protein